MGYYFRSLTGSVVGKTLYCVPRENYLGAPFVATVTKVGRKYVSVSSKRGELKFGINDACHYDPGGFGYKYDLWPDRDAYERSKRTQDAWENLRRLMDSYHSKSDHYGPPKGVDEAAIETARKLLNLNNE